MIAYSQCLLEKSKKFLAKLSISNNININISVFQCVNTHANLQATRLWGYKTSSILLQKQHKHYTVLHEMIEQTLCLSF